MHVYMYNTVKCVKCIVPEITNHLLHEKNVLTCVIKKKESIIILYNSLATVKFLFETFFRVTSITRKMNICICCVVFSSLNKKKCMHSYLKGQLTRRYANYKNSGLNRQKNHR